MLGLLIQKSKLEFYFVMYTKQILYAGKNLLSELINFFAQHVVNF